ncbi:UNVERIFIED_CONTAM: hypothetical protein GTU68_050899 [Idotea baltica]|nr:hypothetical protein [Idotea baltica]
MIVKGYCRPLPIAIFCGIGKPDLSSFLTKLCAELTLFTTCGVFILNQVVKISGIQFICDAPARSYLQCIKGHSGYYGCGYCRQKGLYLEDRIIFPDVFFESRDDNGYLNFRENNQISESPLLGIVPLYSGFPPDYMHLCCLGVMRKLCHYFFTPTKGVRLACKLSRSKVKELSHLIESFKSCLPREFQRKPRSLSELEHFKATEFRNLLLYLGPFFFKSFLVDEYYQHFLLLHYAMYIFVSTRFSYLYDLAERCIQVFVNDSMKLYGRKSLIYNVHTLLHLSHFVKLYGPVDTFSCFPFENHLSILKKRIYSNSCVFKQSVDQLFQIRSIYTNSSSDYLFFSKTSPDNCAIVQNNEIVLVDSVVSGCRISGYFLIFSHNLYSTPYPSKSLGIGYYKKTKKFVSDCVPVSKAICILVEDCYLIIPYA